MTHPAETEEDQVGTGREVAEGLFALGIPLEFGITYAPADVTKAELRGLRERYAELEEAAALGGIEQALTTTEVAEAF